MLLVFFVLVLSVNQFHDVISETPARVETNPLLLDSFIPAGMQIIAYVTEMMKYDSIQSMVTTTTQSSVTFRPTRPHKPAIYQPQLPPGPEAYFAKTMTYEEYIERLKYPSGGNYFDHLYNFPLVLSDDNARSLLVEELPENLDQIFGKGPIDLLRIVNSPEQDSNDLDLGKRLDDFARTYDDAPLRYVQVRKQIKEIKAYVSLLSLYEDLNKESKAMKLNKYSGYTDNVLKVLIDTSSGSSANQLHTVLTKIVDRTDTKNPKVIKRLMTLINDLETVNSSVNKALRYIPPLKFMP